MREQRFLQTVAVCWLASLLLHARGSAPPSFVKVVPINRARPFIVLKDPLNAGGDDVQRLYEQAARISSIAYQLFAAAEPLAQAEGSTAALLPYLSPTIIRLYVTQPERCSSDLIFRMYNLSNAMCGSDLLKACHYDLYRALGAAFTWIRSNMPLRLQQIPGQPLATTAWPDLHLISPLEFTMAVEGALTQPQELQSGQRQQLGGDTAELLQNRCGLSAQHFAALTSNISAVLSELHADLAFLQQLAKQLYDQNWGLYDKEDEADNDAVGEGSAVGRVPVAEALPGSESDRRVTMGGRLMSDRLVGAGATAERLLSSGRRRQTVELGSSSSGGGESSFFYDMPPDAFLPASPAALPLLLLPLVFHIMLYPNRLGGLAPALYDQAPAFVNRLIQVANFMARPANLQMFVKEVRNDPNVYPYLRLSDRVTWLLCPGGGTYVDECLRNHTFVSSIIADFPRSVNIFIASDSTVVRGLPMGYAWAPGSDVTPGSGFIFMSWDQVLPSGANSLELYNDGPNTLLHELLHHLGLRHTFTTIASGTTSGGEDYTNGAGASGISCLKDADYVIDTPTTLGAGSSSSFAATATAYCMELFWGQYGGDWEATYDRWSRTLGIPETDMNAWADSCPGKPGYDELGNYMTYSTPVCFAALGHLTAAQAQRLHYVTSELNPVLYAWAQYYAQYNSSPPPSTSAPLQAASSNICKVSRDNCACTSSWTLNGSTYFACDRVFSNDTLVCEVLDPAACSSCITAIRTAVGGSTRCLATCAGTARTCRRSLAPRTNNPPPPPPRLLSPPRMPPPPPPRRIPDECKRSGSGCLCRRTWRHINGALYSYCAAPKGEVPLV